MRVVADIELRMPVPVQISFLKKYKLHFNQQLFIVTNHGCLMFIKSVNFYISGNKRMSECEYFFYS